MDKDKRTLAATIAGGVVLPPFSGLLLTRSVSAADRAKLSPDDPAAKALLYAQVSSDANKLCAGCQFYTAVDNEWGSCVLFPDRLVSATGACNSWFKRAG